jgi:ssDNA-binding Zn-finger/Zn-ribbon topoisomerase 1
MFKVLLNRPEQITYDRLAKVCARHGAHVFAKVRLADVLPVERSGIPDELYRYALQAHYDFVVTDYEQAPLFAVEFDGPQHAQGRQAELDGKKDELSRRFGFTVLRVHAGDLSPAEGRLDHLSRLVDQWFAGHAAGRRRGDTPASQRCPLCGGDMTEKAGRYGPFLSCFRYPVCKGKRDLPAPPPPPPPEPRPTRCTEGRGDEPQQGGVPVKALAGVAVGLGCLTVLALVTVITVVVVLRRDAPQDKPTEPAARAAEPSAEPPTAPATRSIPKPPTGGARGGADAPATVPQMNLLGLLVRRKGWSEAERDAQVEKVLGCRRQFTQIRKWEASKLIDAWDDRQK